MTVSTYCGVFGASTSREADLVLAKKCDELSTRIDALEKQPATKEAINPSALWDAIRDDPDSKPLGAGGYRVSYEIIMAALAKLKAAT